ncbi:MAG: hypothetical protein IJM48_07735 [Treponema sp.]|nr:hypothetical protein [Treponema sp.]
MFKKALSVFLVLSGFCFSPVSVNSQNISNSALVANRRTAVRYLQLSKQFASEKLWSEADSNARMGLAYDDKIADLWYLHAVSQMNLGEKKSKIIPLVVTALTDSDWLDYNRDGARILYSDLLCSTRQFVQSLSVLDSEPFLYSADAEYIRAKAYYSLGDEENLKKARSRLDAARRVYPADSRFAELFYTHEYQIFRRQGYLAQEARSLSEAFALMIPHYKNARDDLEVYAAIFTDDEAKKVRMLKAFNSKKLKSPLYALQALKSGLLDEDSALDYFYQFSDKKIALSVLEDFAALLKSEEAKKEFSEYLNSYNGIISIDTDADLTENITVAYKRGRPESIFYDENQDDENEWTAACDFGLPVRISLAENALELEYSSWPYISAAVYKMPLNHADLRFTLIAETLSWTPFTVETDSNLSQSLAADFYIPRLCSPESNTVSGSDLLRSALSYSIPSKEREGAVIQVSLLNGLAQLASYSVGDKIYAMAQFEKGIPVSRKLDVDGDGLFETCEYYGFSQEHEQNFISTNDEMQIMTNLFGSPAQGTGFYVKKITVDRNGDTIPDFTEEYLAASEGDKIPGKISSWDTDGDGEWDVQYVKHPSSFDGRLREEAKFHYPMLDTAEFSEKSNSSAYGNALVTVLSENSIPVSVQIQNKKTTDFLPIEKGLSKNFYWISKACTKEDEDKIINEVNQIADQGFSIIVEGADASSKKRFLAVRIEKLIFGMEVQN